MPALEITPEDGATMATYWFAKLAAAIDRADFILAAEARGQLQGLGFEVRQLAQSRRRKGKGGTPCQP